MSELLDEFSDKAKHFSAHISELVASATLVPNWDEKQGGWRHHNHARNVSLYVLTKLAGIASTVNAAFVLARAGYWFQVSILSRSVVEAQLSIAFVLPVPNEQWPSEKQKQAIMDHFLETWADPSLPFSDRRQRPTIRDLSAAIGKLQDGAGVLSRSDAQSTAQQSMRILSDYTHMAYPTVMELLEGGRGYILEGNESSKTSREVGLVRLLNDSYSYAIAVATFHTKMFSGFSELARARSSPSQNLNVHLEAIEIVLSKLQSEASELDNELTGTEAECRRLLAAFKGKT